MSEIEISVVIPTFNRKALLHRCLQVLLHGTYPAERYEIIVVDDGSTDDTEALVLELEANYNIRYIKQERQGPAAARNRGVGEARGAMVAFTDDDCLPAGNWLEEIVYEFQRDVSISAVTGNTLPLDEEGFGHRVGAIYKSQRSASTSNIAYRAEAIRNLGLFDATFVTSWEDADLFFRFRRKGYRFRYLPSMLVRHPHERRIEEFKKQWYFSGIGFSHFFKKYLAKRPHYSLGYLFLVLFAPLINLPKVWLRKEEKNQCYSLEQLRLIVCLFRWKGFLSGILGNSKHVFRSYRY